MNILTRQITFALAAIIKFIRRNPLLCLTLLASGLFIGYVASFNVGKKIAETTGKIVSAIVAIPMSFLSKVFGKYGGYIFQAMLFLFAPVVWLAYNICFRQIAQWYAYNQVANLSATTGTSGADTPANQQQAPEPAQSESSKPATGDANIITNAVNTVYVQMQKLFGI